MYQSLKGMVRDGRSSATHVGGPDFTAASTERIAERIVPRSFGCLCCVAHSGMMSSLRCLYAQRAKGEIDFDQVLIETLADANPAAVMQALSNNALVFFDPINETGASIESTKLAGSYPSIRPVIGIGLLLIRLPSTWVLESAFGTLQS